MYNPYSKGQVTKCVVGNKRISARSFDHEPNEPPENQASSTTPCLFFLRPPVRRGRVAPTRSRGITHTTHAFISETIFMRRLDRTFSYFVSGETTATENPLQSLLLSPIFYWECRHHSGWAELTVPSSISRKVCKSALTKRFSAQEIETRRFLHSIYEENM